MKIIIGTAHTHGLRLKLEGQKLTLKKKNNSRIETPPKKNVTLRCYVEYVKRSRDYKYNKQIKIFIKGNNSFIYFYDHLCFQLELS